MSMMLMVRAMKTKVGNPLRKLVLIKLADNANDNGECWPSHQHVADQCEISRTSVRNHIKKLEQMGLLRIERRDGPKGNTSNLYHLTLHPVAGDDIGIAGDGIGGIAGDDTRTSHSFEPIIEPSKRFSPDGDTPPEKPKKPTIDYSVLQMTDDQVEEVKRIRKQTKGVNSQRAINQLAKECDLSRRRGFSNDDILNEWTTRGWRSYKDEWNRSKPSVKVKATPSQPTKNTSLDDEIRELMESGL